MVREELSITFALSSKDTQMLLRLILENFLSFDTAQEFNMFPNLKREGNIHHIYTEKAIPLLKQAAIYGNNAAGKSNLIKGIDMLRSFAVGEAFLSKDIIERHTYRLRKDTATRPIELLVEFEAEEQYFIYDVALSHEGIEREDLYISGLGEENTLLYHRTFEVVELGATLLSHQEEQWKHTKDIVKQMLNESHRYSSFLSLLKKFPVLQNENLENASRWFTKQLQIIHIHSELPQLIALLDKDPNILEFANRIFSELSIGVDGVNVQSTDKEEWVLKHSNDLPLQTLQKLQTGKTFSAYSSPNRPIFTALMENGQKKIQELLFKQMSQEGTFNLDIQDQSDGTVRILTLLPAIYAAMMSETTVFIDEINYCIHPKLLFDLVRFFATSQTKGQVIFSTHETELMEQNRLLRTDEIWLVDKKEGQSLLYSLNEFKVHNTISIRRGYREGRFGGSYRGSINAYQDEELSLQQSN